MNIVLLNSFFLAAYAFCYRRRRRRGTPQGLLSGALSVLLALVLLVEFAVAA